MPIDIPAPAPIDSPTGILSKATPNEIPKPVPIDKAELNIKTGILLFLQLAELDSILILQLNKFKPYIQEA